MKEQGETNLESERLRGVESQLTILIDSAQIPSQPTDIEHRADQLAEREIASDAIAKALVESATGQSTARSIAQLHEKNPVPPQLAVYVHWGILRKITTDYPESQIPAEFLDFLETLALSTDEVDADVVFDVLSARTQGIYKLESDEKIELTPVEFLAVQSDATVRQFFLQHSINREQISKDKSPKVTQDLDRLTAREGSLDELMQDITNRAFLTLKGFRAACSQQDAERLLLRTGTPQALLRDIENQLFKTSQGLNAACNLQDTDRLSLRKGKPDMLLDDILSRRLKTTPGYIAATFQQDADRLDIDRNDIVKLKRDLKKERFLTTPGIKLAHERLNELLHHP